MQPKLLVLVTSDPRTSARPAEAVRIAAGVGTWKKAEVTLYLRGPAVRAVSEFTDDLIDEDNFTRYLPIVGEFPRPIYVQRGAHELTEVGESPVKYAEISDAELVTLTSAATYVMRF
ncbi:MAG TPA: hypothetical protein PLX89_00480 [Verrucomicrobiota bacterium]|nr:hypothetical protein [Verrucomicrobiales bacterium]HRI11452.1 hypothetical protein [Verrucomicrobiota bacterium]